ncbi:hypothetical protein MYCTH_2298152 [Thermothelomyces thermophilus ATCC 42464]|uniref:ABC1 atypical kinase-like domain-containing protein n=1 Tax=Thermothelomyces thermophilus (strain ATCC 42464 / BCRC 31852 / DSM 1799) TaxID=573729 RepID=G2Q136_THET4|nr:uncharacterized protein MYCTH_2298152 [Thermothelomyces thermophilus ATCC 42464]AEO54935.1 hypothetical protein MYCTH_2298152 [Thermothelomyces thermophilus ATCC 42464]
MWRLGIAGAPRPAIPSVVGVGRGRCALRSPTPMLTPTPRPRPRLRLRLRPQLSPAGTTTVFAAGPDRPFSSTVPRPVLGPSSGPFEPLRPPTPSSLGQPRAARTFRRTRRWARRLALLSALLGAGYLLDRQVYASGISRSLRTFGVGLLVAADYKLNFRAEPLPLIGSAGGIDELHRRSAERLSDLLRENGGLYLKIGQAIAMQSAVLPPEFQRMFARMFDDAPQDDWAAVEKVIRDDFGGRSVEDVFGVSFAGAEGKGVMERTARASASVAQVHWARLPDGREVAVKIQKPEIAKQIGWDLWAFK